MGFSAVGPITSTTHLIIIWPCIWDLSFLHVVKKLGEHFPCGQGEVNCGMLELEGALAGSHSQLPLMDTAAEV